MARNNTTLYLIVGILAIVVIYFVWVHTSKKSESYRHDAHEEVGDSDYQPVEDIDDDFEKVADEEAFNIGFGTGPGLYGSGRHTSEMVGN
jgi:hypothetical protein